MATFLGASIYSAFFGYYWMARGQFSPRGAVQAVLRMPLIYAVLGGLALNALHVKLPEMWQDTVTAFQGTIVVMGAMIIGMGMSKYEKIRWNWKLLGVLTVIKYALWPALTVLLLLGLDLTPLAVPALYKPVLLLFSVLPMAANTAVFAAMLDVYPEEAATAVTVSTLLSLIMVPAYLLVFGISYA